jgi:hypothetical protein
MDWTRRSGDGAGAWQARCPAAILAVAGAMVLALAGVGCSHGTGPANIVAEGSGSGCPTKGVGGDTQPPLCASPTGGSNSGTNGINNPVGVSGPATAPASGNISPHAEVTPSISGPVAPSSPPPSEATAPPQVSAVSPATGAAVGGDSVTITGSGFTGATEVDFGDTSASMTVVSDTQITATSPPGSGIVDVTVVTPNGASATGPGDQFSYSS